jgi:predicted helicase
MRKNLLECFDKIYISDLHGNSKRREKAPDGSPDQNVFDIMPGVSINIMIKSKKLKNNDSKKVLFTEVYGLRDYKYNFLRTEKISTINWNWLDTDSPHFFFVHKNLNESSLPKQFNIRELFPFFNSGLTTEFDELAIQDTENDSLRLRDNLTILEPPDIARIYNISESKMNKIENAITDIQKNNSNIKDIFYRPFDRKFILYTGKTNGIMGRPRFDLMRHFYNDNLGLIVGRQGQAIGGNDWNIVTITNSFTDSNIFYRGRGSVFPLYLYPQSSSQETFFDIESRKPNLNYKIINEICANLDLSFVSEKETTVNTFAPIDILDYIYAVLHSPTYREKYKEFLKIDFPRVPYPRDAETFWALVELGGELRQIHLLESPVVEQFITTYPITGNNIVTKPRFESLQSKTHQFTTSPLHQLGQVWINDQQYFDGVPLVAWEFYIGGYQPAQKWLKDRKGRVLSFEDIQHYQKIIVALNETDRLMKEIDKIDIE